MKIRFVMLLLACLAAPSAQAAVTLVFQGPFYLEVDGRYYVAEAGPLIGDLGVWWNREFASMRGCRRANDTSLGQNNETFFWGNPIVGGLELALTTAPLSPTQQPRVRVQFRDDVVVVSVTTKTGDAVCTGEVPAPTSSTIFRAGFE